MTPLPTLFRQAWGLAVAAFIGLTLVQGTASAAPHNTLTTVLEALSESCGGLELALAGETASTLASDLQSDSRSVTLDSDASELEDNEQESPCGYREVTEFCAERPLIRSATPAGDGARSVAYWLLSVESSDRPRGPPRR